MDFGHYLTFLKFLPQILFQCFISILEWFLPNKLFEKNVSQDTVLITGAGSGLGRNIAIEFAKLGANTVIWDINKQSLDETKYLIEQVYLEQNENEKKRKCLSYLVDLSKKDMIQNAARQIEQDLNSYHKNNKSKQQQDEQHKTYISILINNAGIYYGSFLSNLSDNQIEKIFDINILSHFWTIRAFLPAMIENKNGHIVEIASMAGINGFHKQVDYCSTKFATIGLEEALHYELDHLGLGKCIRTTVVCPFFFSSNLFTNYSQRAKTLMDCQYVAKQTIVAIRCNFNRLLLPIKFGYFSLLLRSILPREAQILSSKAFGLAECVKDIKGKAANFASAS